MEGSIISEKVFYHFGQLTQGFQKYDYGKAENLAIYGSEKPPEFSLENVQIPIVLISGSHDSLTTSEVITNYIPRQNVVKGHKNGNFGEIELLLSCILFHCNKTFFTNSKKFTGR